MPVAVARQGALDSLARIAAAEAARTVLDSARTNADWAAAGPVLCTDTRAVPESGVPLGRDSLLSLIARARLLYALTPVWDGAVLSASPNDSTVIFDGRARAVARGGGVRPAVWIYREFRRRPTGWCQVFSRVRP